MRTILFIILSIFLQSKILSQVGIGTKTPANSAILELKASNKGFLPPRVALNAKNDTTTILSPQIGLLIYNMSNAGISPNEVSPGFYYFNGINWVLIATGAPDATIEFSIHTDPNNLGTVFTPNILQSKDYVYVSTIDGSQWTWNGSSYKNSNPPKTPFYISTSTTDAGNNKTSSIYRNGSIGIGVSTPNNKLEISHGINGNSGLRFTNLNTTSNTQLNNGLQLSLNSNGDVILTPDAVNANKAWSTTGNSSTNPSTNFIGTTDGQPLVMRTNNIENIRLTSNGSLGIGTSNPLKKLHVQSGGTSILTSSFGDGLLYSTNSGAGCRIFLEHLSAGTDLKTSVIYSQSGTTIFGATLNDNGSAWIKTSPISVSHATGNVGINTTFSQEQLTVNGAIKIANGGYSGLINGATTPIPSGGSGTIVFNGANFFGWNGSMWKQLDN